MAGGEAKERSQSVAHAPSEYAEHQKTHCNCIVCGRHSPIGLGIKFEPRLGGSVHARFYGSSLFQGYRGIIHGGIIATLLDATMTHCLFHNGIQALTGDLQVRYLKQVPCNVSLDLRARISSRFPPLYKVESEMIHQGIVMAWAKAKFMQAEF